MISTLRGFLLQIYTFSASPQILPVFFTQKMLTNIYFAIFLHFNSKIGEDLQDDRYGDRTDGTPHCATKVNCNNYSYLATIPPIILLAHKSQKDS